MAPRLVDPAATVCTISVAVTAGGPVTSNVCQAALILMNTSLPPDGVIALCLPAARYQHTFVPSSMCSFHVGVHVNVGGSAAVAPIAATVPNSNCGALYPLGAVVRPSPANPPPDTAVGEARPWRAVDSKSPSAPPLSGSSSTWRTESAARFVECWR